MKTEISGFGPCQVVRKTCSRNYAKRSVKERNLSQVEPSFKPWTVIGRVEFANHYISSDMQGTLKWCQIFCDFGYLESPFTCTLL